MSSKNGVFDHPKETLKYKARCVGKNKFRAEVLNTSGRWRHHRSPMALLGIASLRGEGWWIDLRWALPRGVDIQVLGSSGPAGRARLSGSRVHTTSDSLLGESYSQQRPLLRIWPTESLSVHWGQNEGRVEPEYHVTYSACNTQIRVDEGWAVVDQSKYIEYHAHQLHEKQHEEGFVTSTVYDTPD